MRMRVIEVTADPIDTAACIEQLRLPGCGAIVTFEGITRSPDDAGDAVTLDYEAWEERALTVMGSIVDAACSRGPLAGVVAIHRVGAVGPQEPAVVVAVAAPHRAEAFAAASTIIDRIKAEAPIWKRERTVSRGTWIGIPEADPVGSG